MKCKILYNKNNSVAQPEAGPPRAEKKYKNK